MGIGYKVGEAGGGAYCLCRRGRSLGVRGILVGGVSFDVCQLKGDEGDDIPVFSFFPWPCCCCCCCCCCPPLAFSAAASRACSSSATFLVEV